MHLLKKLTGRLNLWLIVALLVTFSGTAWAQTDHFVKVKDGQLMLDGQPYYFLGINYWYGMNLGADVKSGDRGRLERELDQLQSLGIENLRVLAASEGPDDEPWRVVPTTQPAPGKYNENVLKGLDVLLDEMAKRDMHATLILNNFFQWSGGMSQYVSWATGDSIPYPNYKVNTWNQFQKFSARFYSLPKAMDLNNRYIKMLIHRKNTVNGKVYNQDPTIMSWELGNEPRVFGADEDTYFKWVKETAGMIQQEAPNQLVALGGEGKMGPVEGDRQFQELGKIPELDYLTAHLWIENWSIYDAKEPGETFFPAIGFSAGYIANHLAIAKKYNKPMVLEEFGVSRDGGNPDPAQSVKYRDEYYTFLFRDLVHLVSEGTEMAGYNVWSYGGEGRPTKPGAIWHPGDPFIGDPPHESQGWYSIYDKDQSTLQLFKKYNDQLDELLRK